jgi:hypothetical protein
MHLCKVGMPTGVSRWYLSDRPGKCYEAQVPGLDLNKLGGTAGEPMTRVCLATRSSQCSLFASLLGA